MCVRVSVCARKGFRETSLVRTLPGTLEEILAMGDQEAAIAGGTKGREVGMYIAHTMLMRVRSGRSADKPVKAYYDGVLAGHDAIDVY